MNLLLEIVPILRRTLVIDSEGVNKQLPDFRSDPEQAICDNI